VPQKFVESFSVSVIGKDDKTLILQKLSQERQHIVNGGGGTNVELGSEGQSHLVQSIAHSASPATLNYVAVNNKITALPLEYLKLPLGKA